MSHRLLALVAAVALVASFAGTAAVGAQHAVDAQQASHATTVTASGQGEVTASPDYAVVTVASTASAETASGATSALAANASRLRATLDNTSLPVESVQTSAFSVFQRDTDAGTEFSARQVFRVTVSNTSAVGGVVDAAVAGGATEVFGVTFTLSEAARERLRSQAIARAVADAREQAAAAAGAANVTLGPPASVDVLGESVGPLAERAADAGTVIDAGPVAVTASVRVTYNATA